MENEDIRFCLLKCGVSQTELAKRLGVARITIAKALSRPLTEKYKKRILEAIKTELQAKF